MSGRLWLRSPFESLRVSGKGRVSRIECALAVLRTLPHTAYDATFSSGAKESSSFLMPASPWKATTIW